ncbi:hypothetical protein WMF38_56995 [Sorangium sp. So ce118]
MTTAPPRRVTPFPRPPGSTQTVLRDGIPWTTLSGFISPEMLRAATARFADLGGSEVWAVDADAATASSRDALTCALDQMLYLKATRGLALMVASIKDDVVRMSAGVLRMRLAEQVRLVVVGAAWEIETEMARQRAWLDSRKEKK